MALAGDQHDVAIDGGLDGQADGGAAVGLDEQARGSTRRDTGEHGGDDGSRILAAGVVRRDHRHIGEGRRGGAHGGPLGGVAVAAAAEHHEDAPSGGLPSCRQGLRQAVGRVGVVDDHGEALAGVDRLEPAGHHRGGRQPGGHGGVVDAEGAGRGGGGDGVGHVEAAAQGEANRVAPPGEPGVVGRHDHVVGVGSRVRQRGDRRGVEEELAVGIVTVHHGDVAEIGLEQAGLGREVASLGVVEVQVVPAEVGEHRHGEARRVDAVHGQSVRRHLHRDGAPALVTEGRQPLLELGRLGRGVGPRERADDAGRPAGRLEHRGQQVGDGRLAVRAGHADDGEAGRGLAEERGRERRHRHARVLHDHLGHVEVERPLDEQRDGPAGDGCGSEVVPVDPLAPQAAEQRAGPDAARVVGDRHRRHGRLAPTTDDPQTVRARLGHECVQRLARRPAHRPAGAGQPPPAVGGGTSNWRSAACAAWTNSGAATRPP